MTEQKHLTKEEATKFFADMVGGEHHLLSPIKECGYGFSYSTRNDLSTYDFDLLTLFVVMCHDKCYRGSIMPSAPNTLRLVIWKRQREGGISERHPTLEDNVKRIRERILTFNS